VDTSRALVYRDKLTASIHAKTIVAVS
jgi:hypothetical protein